MNESCGSSTSVLSFFILTLVISLIFGGILNTAAIGTDAFAKKGSRIISDRTSNDDNGRTSGSSDKGSSLDVKIFNPTPFWNKAKPIIEEMRSKRSDSHYENFESLNTKRLSWKKKRSITIRR